MESPPAYFQKFIKFVKLCSMNKRASAIYLYIQLIVLCVYIFILQNTILYVLFVLAFIAGGIVNAIYASENSNLHFDLCLSYDSVDELCRQLERVAESEGASAVS